ncbi:2,3-dihydro-2,3-dihydroxybenzoate dehydrogenase [Saccharothrix syringae]|uniref:2,3-dihydro-2,3-dihydroxybenzoate dehydrogenase n=1 Tax=Saccharothrix syringae TaxID=103733 RepID=A0A5Q0H0A5_SACSY|nr:2,3-dihydro-2,3-dihydroxybenzoate dehydrogenase [Saccharothrix syringae]QFZ19619.1 2,3-dihydro-2,3-dihydroxybenzoate dehydrogenase [Saccharothrix syringae]
MRTEEFAGRVAIVTGAAGGIGQAVVLALVDLGAAVAAVDLDGEALRALERKANVGRQAVRGFTADVREPADAVVAEVERRLGPVDFLVNGAGVLRPGPALEMGPDDWDAVLSVNAGGVFHFSTAAARRMVERGRGAVVTVSSNAAGVPRTRMSAYCASKAAATAFTKALGLELAVHGIRCNVVAPGSTDTAMLRSLWTDDSGPANSLAGSLPEYRVGIPLRKFATPEDIADAVVFLLSDRAAHITLQDLYVDGGAALGR